MNHTTGYSDHAQCNFIKKKRQRLHNVTCNFINLQFFYAQKGTQVSSSATRPPCLKMKKYQQLTYSLLHCMSEMDTAHSSDRLLQVFYLKQVKSER